MHTRTPYAYGVYHPHWLFVLSLSRSAARTIASTIGECNAPTHIWCEQALNINTYQNIVLV